MMSIDTTSYPSPNHDARPLVGGSIRALVLHSGEGSRASDLATLTSAADKVSSHYYVDRAGRIYQLVPLDRRAWHAGYSDYLGQVAWNNFSIGIETEHKKGQNWPNPQLGVLHWLCATLICRYRIHQSMVVAHRWIAVRPPGRKTDPTNWDDTDLKPWIKTFYPELA